MHPVSGRVYHPCSERGGGVGLVRSALAIELSPFFVYALEDGQSGQPTHCLWRGQKHRLTNELAGCFPSAEEGCGQQGYHSLPPGRRLMLVMLKWLRAAFERQVPDGTVSACLKISLTHEDHIHNETFPNSDMLKIPQKKCYLTTGSHTPNVM